MNNTEEEIKLLITGLIEALHAKGVKDVSATKILLLINDKFRIELEQDALEKILSDCAAITEINGDQIILGNKETEDEQENEAEIEDTAQQQAFDNLTSESVDYNIKKPLLGKTFKITKSLNESIDNYHLLKSIKDNNSELIISDVLLENKNIVLKCKISGTSFYVNIDKKMI